MKIQSLKRQLEIVSEDKRKVEVELAQCKNDLSAKTVVVDELNILNKQWEAKFNRVAASNFNEDLSILVNNGWVTDSIIDSCIENSQFNKNIRVLCNGIVSLFRHSSLDATEIAGLAPKDLLICDFLLCFVSNASKSELSGSHWSIVCFDLKSLHCLHFDSVKNANQVHARNLVKKIGSFLGLKFTFFECETFQQTNTFDCGIEAYGNLIEVISHISMSASVSDIKLVQNDTVEIRKKLFQFFVGNSIFIDFT